jgi:hypothetical protein
MNVVREDVGRPATGNDEQIALRISKEDVARAARLQGVLAPPGVAVNRSDVLRAALRRGLEALEADHAGAIAATMAHHKRVRDVIESSVASKTKKPRRS